jgi:Ca-activated chloride channel family protein
MKDITFLNPGFFWLLLLLPPAILWYLWRRREQTAALTMSTLRGFRPGQSILVRLEPVLFGLRLLALAVMIVALARPRQLDVDTSLSNSKGIDIVMAIDLSASMLSKDLKPNRLEALKGVAEDFVESRVADRIGLVVYSGESYTKIPVTSDKEVLKTAIRELKYEDDILKTGTGIGIGLATAVNRIKDSKAKSRVIILMTDGVNNTGTIDPSTAADIAKEMDIRVYTIGIGTIGTALTLDYAPDGSMIFRQLPVNIDEELLKEIAKKTHGKYYRATTNTKLMEIYKEIDKLEKTEMEDTRYLNYVEKYSLLVWIALGLVTIEAILRRTLYKSFV